MELSSKAILKQTWHALNGKNTEICTCRYTYCVLPEEIQFRHAPHSGFVEFWFDPFLPTPLPHPPHSYVNVPHIHTHNASGNST